MGQMVPKFLTDAPIARGWRSKSVTDRPRLAARYACASPRMPPPTTASCTWRVDGVMRGWTLEGGRWTLDAGWRTLDAGRWTKASAVELDTRSRPVKLQRFRVVSREERRWPVVSSEGT